jgi:hypothetical protein
LQFGRDFLEWEGAHIHARELFGSKWIQRIVSLAFASSYNPDIMLTHTKHDLYAVEAIEPPNNMNIVLHPHQLKDAAQMYFYVTPPLPEESWLMVWVWARRTRPLR